jgi:hypothetical protein
MPSSKAVRLVMSSPHISAFKRLGIFTSEAKIARSTVTVHIVQLLGLETMVHGIGPLMLEKIVVQCRKL